MIHERSVFIFISDSYWYELNDEWICLAIFSCHLKLLKHLSTISLENKNILIKMLDLVAVYHKRLIEHKVERPHGY